MELSGTGASRHSQHRAQASRVNEYITQACWTLETLALSYSSRTADLCLEPFSQDALQASKTPSCVIYSMKRCLACLKCNYRRQFLTLCLLHLFVHSNKKLYFALR